MAAATQVILAKAAGDSRIVRMAGPGGIRQETVVAGIGVAVLKHRRQGIAGALALRVHAADDAGNIALPAGGGNGAALGGTALHKGVQPVLIDGNARRQAIYGHADHFAVAFAENLHLEGASDRTAHGIILYCGFGGRARRLCSTGSVSLFRRVVQQNVYNEKSV